MTVQLNDPPWVMGIAASHNGAVCLLHGDRIVVAIQEERLTRVKRQRTFGAAPLLSILYCLQTAGISADQLDLIVLCTQEGRDAADNDLAENPLLNVGAGGTPTLKISHHLGHAVSVYALSGFSDSAILVADGMGSPWSDLPDWERTASASPASNGFEIISLYDADGVDISAIDKRFVANGNWLGPAGGTMPQFGSFGGMFAAASLQIFGTHTDAGKVMGLAPYGEAQWKADEFFTIKNDELLFRNAMPAVFRTDQRWPNNKEAYQNLARSVQDAFEEGLLHFARTLRARTGRERLCFSGGVALNVVANERLFAEAGFREVFIAPAADDSGTAIGAAYWGLWSLTRENARERLASDSLGRIYSNTQIKAAVAKEPQASQSTESDHIGAVVDILCDGGIVGWFDGGAELGPRALGQRSILCDPRHPQAKEALNHRIKRRDTFQPFAPVVLKRDVQTWFDGCPDDFESPFMLRVRPFKADRRSLVPAVVHTDGTGRLQTVTRENNGALHRLLEAYKSRTGVPLLLNTSFNGRNEPIVETPGDAIRCMLANGLDHCVFPDTIVTNTARHGDQDSN